jgi:hypothetical protein
VPRDAVDADHLRSLDRPDPTRIERLPIEPALVETAAEPDPQLAAAIAAILPKLPPRR